MSSREFCHYFHSLPSLNLHIDLKKPREFNFDVARFLSDVCSIFKLLHANQKCQYIC
jgi:hypothetical protein